MRPRDPFARVAEFDPVPNETGLPRGAMSTEAILDAIDWRTEMAAPQKLRTDRQPEPATRNRTRLAALMGAAAAVLLVLGFAIPQGAIVLFGSGDAPDDVLAAYEEAFNAKDIDAVMALWAEDAVLISDPLGGTPEGSAIELFESSRIQTTAVEDGHTFHNIEVLGDSVTFDSDWVGSDGVCMVGLGHTVTVENGQITRWTYGTFSITECDQ